MNIAIEERELDALQGQNHSLMVLYVHLKRFMDYDTAIVGYKRRISRQSISEAMYLEPSRGYKVVQYSIDALRRMLDKLIDLGLLRRVRKDTLVFSMPLSYEYFLVQNKAARPTPPKAPSKKALQANNHGDVEEKAAPTFSGKPPHLHSPHNTNIAAAASIEPPLAINVPTNTKNAAADNFIFHKSLPVETHDFLLNATNGLNAETRQMLFDELTGFIDKRKVKSNPMALFLTFVGQVKTGTFMAVYANAVRKLRENPPPEKKPDEAPTAEQLAEKKEKGRAAMGNVMQMFNRKKAND